MKPEQMNNNKFHRFSVQFGIASEISHLAMLGASVCFCLSDNTSNSVDMYVLGGKMEIPAKRLNHPIDHDHTAPVSWLRR